MFNWPNTKPLSVLALYCVVGRHVREVKIGTCDLHFSSLIGRKLVTSRFLSPKYLTFWLLHTLFSLSSLSHKSHQKKKVKILLYSSIASSSSVLFFFIFLLADPFWGSCNSHSLSQSEILVWFIGQSFSISFLDYWMVLTLQFFFELRLQWCTRISWFQLDCSCLRSSLKNELGV